MKNRMKKTISVIMVLILLLGAFAGCGDAMYGNKETTPSVNAENMPRPLTDEEIDNIIGQSIDLSPEKEEEIKEICTATYGFKKEEIQIECKGEFNGAYAIKIETRWGSPETFEIVNGIEFVYNREFPVKIVYEGECYSLTEAVSHGIINSENLETIFWRCKWSSRVPLEARFDGHTILLLTMPSCNFKEYTPEDFSEINCISVDDISGRITEGEICRFLALEIPGDSKQNVLDAIKVLEKRRDIYIAEPNFIESADISPNDQKYSDQELAFNIISLPSAWNITTGSTTVVVGVIDTGIDGSHPDLEDVVDQSLSHSYLGGNDNPLVDVDGHGTHIAGIIGAQGNDGDGVTGVCWNVKLVSLKVTNDSDDFNLRHVVDAINYANDIGIDILNYSGGGNDYTSLAQLREAAIRNFTGLFVCSAGNKNLNNDTNPHYPSNHDLPNLISVGASNNNDEKKNDSNYGKTTVDIFAPGEYIVNCYPIQLCVDGTHDTVHTYHKYEGYHALGGTSMATPMVAGVAALMLANNPNLKPHEIKCIIMRNVDCVGTACGNCSCNAGVRCGNCNSDLWDRCVSDGRLNAYAALSDTNQGHIYEVIYNNGNTAGHASECEYCKHICSSVNEFSYVNIGNTSTHNIVCDTCGYYYTGEHSFNDYTNLGPIRGHNAICSQCGYYYVEQHFWQGGIGGFECSKCGCETSTPPEGPGIMSDDDEEETE